ncbi:MAG: FtsX-like permease family protein [bacterium]|nr:FtsX-like permease family protein [bacterium]
MNRRFVLRMLRREARSSRRQLLLYGSCMALGIASLVGLHGMRATTEQAVDAQSRRLLGGDLRVKSRGPIEGAEVELLLDFEARAETRTARVTRFGSMALATGSGRSRLVDIQAVEPHFPLYGSVQSEPVARFHAIHRETSPAALVDPSLLIQLDTEVGDVLALGEESFEIVGVIKKAPGGFGMQTQIAPRVLIAADRLAATKLIRPGSLVEYQHFIRAAPEVLEPFLAQHATALRDARLEITTVESYRNELNRSFGVLTRYLGLVGLAALALGGIGVASGIRVFVREKLESVALLRSLGASSSDILAVYGLLAMALGAASGVAGSLLGTLLQWGLPTFMQGLLPVDVGLRFESSAVVTGMTLGLWVTLLFAAGPLVDLVRVPPLRALRADFAAEPMPLGGRIAILVALAASVVAVSIWQAPNVRVGLAFASGLAIALAALAAAAVFCMNVLRGRAFERAPYWMRQGIANLFRPRNHTLASVCTVGFGLFLVLTLHGVQHNVMQQIAVDREADRPNLVLFDAQPDQVQPIEALLAERGAVITDRAPLISARISSVAGRTIGEWVAAEPDDRELRWALQREYRLTYGAELRPTETLIEGVWWEGEPVTKVPLPVSIDTSIQQSLGVEVGDEMIWDIQGVEVQGVIESVREVDWDRLATNFFVVLPPGMIENAPQTTVMLARMQGEAARSALQRDLVREFSNVSVLDATLILSAIDTMTQRMARAIRLLAVFTLATGLMILVAATISARQERTREVLLLRTLGASGSTLRQVLATEVVALGLLAAAVGTAIAIASSWGLVRFVFELPFEPPWFDFTLLALASVVVSTLLGALGAGRARRMSPLANLRSGA